MKMNSTQEFSIYTGNTSFASPISRTVDCSYEMPEKLRKKDKKWSIGSIFRKKKKEDSDTSSEEDSHKNFFGLRRRKSKSKKKLSHKTVGTFDHIVIPPEIRTPVSLTLYRHEDSGVFSDPTEGLHRYTNASDNCIATRKVYDDRITDSKHLLTTASVDRNKRPRKQAKARAEARRTPQNASSSEEESNSSLKKFADESKTISKKTRAARTERYLKRRSRDGENPYNYLKLSKSDTEKSNLGILSCGDSSRSHSRSPLMPNLITPDNNIVASLTPPPCPYSNIRCQSIESKYMPSNYYPNKFLKENFPELRSYSYDSNIHRAVSEDVIQTPMKQNNRYSSIGFRDNWQYKHPPTPPPRDPNRVNNGRPDSCAYSSLGRNKRHSDVNSYFNHRYTTDCILPKNLYATRPFSTSIETDSPRSVHRINQLNGDDERSNDIDNHRNKIPTSVTADTSRTMNKFDEFDYLTSKSPRSRRPIFIQETIKSTVPWRKIEHQNNVTNSSVLNCPQSVSPKMFVITAKAKTEVYPVSQYRDDINNNFNINGESPKPNLISSPSLDSANSNLESNEQDSKKPTNLEDALNELEEIYNSLRLGDEDLLERAEQREKEAQANYIGELHPNYSARGALSDSSFSYEPYNNIAPKKKRLTRKERSANIKDDDMAFRKFYRKRSTTINDPQSVVAKVSYLMTSPMNMNDFEELLLHNTSKEPDITHDDVLYRNIKHANTSLKVIEPQPPFGIPLGPIAVGSSNDYLHAKPESIVYRPLFKHKKIPDIIKDDLAFRNLRKDTNKVPVLPVNSNTDTSTSNLRYLQKKRAQRSKSANIRNILDQRNDNDMENEFCRLTDIADAMQIARLVLKEKENRIAATRKGSMSDPDAKYVTTWPSAYSQKENVSSNMSNQQYTRNMLTLLGPKKDPKPKSPEATKRSTNESLSASVEDILSVLEKEAKQTTEKINKELQSLQERKERLAKLKVKTTVSEGVNDLTRRLSDIDAVSNHAKMCEKLLETAISENLDNSSDDGKSSAKITEKVVELPAEPHKSEFIVGLQEFRNIVSDIEIPSIDTSSKTEKSAKVEGKIVESELGSDVKDLNNTSSSATADKAVDKAIDKEIKMTLKSSFLVASIEKTNGKKQDDAKWSANQEKEVSEEDTENENKQLEDKKEEKDDTEPLYENIDVICKKDEDKDNLGEKCHF
ncbi:unnamed protein product [Acanthoscelides obtectus]|uniref:Uncharacterized protein n=1 Tax=Acanthoscelides obtectus TaxID=200917 RepID=A0A9P0PVJ8_ACAOB|nr:unnamed protein product [Acanthoscelides obtectus]CAK1668611.1 hypothetical protein AOBTE_LOCUS26510 [Acanthoscelides obtectus]